eukprot:COSAG06_NODE_2813_length_6243_cov_7.236165_6_plen_64_part_00
MRAMCNEIAFSTSNLNLTRVNWLYMSLYLCTGWRPQYGLTELVDASFDYERAESDPRVVWYPG